MMFIWKFIISILTLYISISYFHLYSLHRKGSHGIDLSTAVYHDPFLPIGNFTFLIEGRTHYKIYEPRCRFTNEGCDESKIETWVVIHGFSEDCYHLRHFMREFQVLDDHAEMLSFDLWGRGYSDAPFADYGAALYVNQITQLLFKLGIGGGGKKFNLIGYSMGGLISASFVNHYYDKIDKYILCAPAGLPMELPINLVQQVIFAPFGFGSFVFHLLYETTQTPRINDMFNFSPDLDYIVEEKIQRFKYLLEKNPGFLRSLLSTLVHLPLDGGVEYFEHISTNPDINPSTYQDHLTRRQLLIWGTEDDYLPYENHEKALEIFPNSDFQRIENVGHYLFDTHYSEVARAIYDWSRKLKN